MCIVLILSIQCLIAGADELHDLFLGLVKDDSQAGLDSLFGKLEGFHRVADAPIQANPDAADTDHIAPVAEHLKGQFACRNDE